MTIAEDVALARRCLDGDDTAWSECIRRYRTQMIELVRRMVGADAAADVVDQVLADVWERRKLEQYAGRSSLGTWFGAVALHAALNARRSRDARRLEPLTNAEARPGAVRSHGSTENQLAAVLNDAIAQLPGAQRALVLLYYEQGITLDEAARLLQTSKASLSRRLKAAREDIRAAAERLALERYGTPLSQLREDADLSQFEFDLRKACATSGRNGGDGLVSKNR